MAGVIYAYYHRKRTLNDIEISHCNYAIKTFWRTLIWGIIGGVLILVAIGILVLIIVGLWYAYRCLKGAVRAFEGAPMHKLPML